MASRMASVIRVYRSPSRSPKAKFRSVVPYFSFITRSPHCVDKRVFRHSLMLTSLAVNTTELISLTNVGGNAQPCPKKEGSFFVLIVSLQSLLLEPPP